MKYYRALFIGLLLGISIVSYALEPFAIRPDSALRYGVLENGLTYYIRHNNRPENCADFYIAQNVGSILEEEDQRGLAHFLEHMAFNGTTHFPGKSMLNYLESIGVKFGENVNAYTSIDETVYNLSNVPVQRETTVDSALLILYDWASQISLETEEINKERGVIKEEWRTRTNARMRQMEQIIPQLYPGSRYANRLPIGDMKVIEHFSPETLRDYYHKWYRPDLQGIVVVGDIDVERVEEKIKTLFSGIPLEENRAERIYYPVADVPYPIVAKALDKEAQQTYLNIFFKYDPLPKEENQAFTGLRNEYLMNMVETMLNLRFEEVAQQADPPFLYAACFDDEFMVSKTKRAFGAAVVTKESEVENGFAALLEELQRVERYGFTPAEYERAKASFLRSSQIRYNERNNQNNSFFVQRYIENFTAGKAKVALEDLPSYAQQLTQIQLDEVNNYIEKILRSDNVAITFSGIEKEGLSYPSQEELVALYEKAQDEEVAPYQETLSEEPLLTNLPAKGSIVKTSYDKITGATRWKLSNGVTVIVKPTDFKTDEVLFSGYRPGGSLLLDESDALQIKVLNDLSALGGIGAFSQPDLRKKLAGKELSLNLSVEERSEEVKGSTTPSDMETFLQLLYLYFGEQRRDSAAFSAWKQQMDAYLTNREKNPMAAFSDSITHALYGAHPRKTEIKKADLEKIDYEKALQLYENRFGNANGFVFTFVGNVSLDSLRPLVEQYIGTLPATAGNKTKTEPIALQAGNYTNHFERTMETPKSSLLLLLHGKLSYTAENIIKMSVLDQILDIIYTETIREEEGGTYGVSTSGSIVRDPGRFMLTIRFTTNAQQEEALQERVWAELQKVAAEGPSETTLEKVRQYMRKQQKINRKQNRYWLTSLQEANTSGINMDKAYDRIVESLSVKSMAHFARELLKKGAVIEVVMRGVTPTSEQESAPTDKAPAP